MKKRFKLILLFSVLVCASVSFAQFKDKEDDPMKKLLNNGSTSTSTSPRTSINADAPQIFDEMNTQNTFSTKAVPIEGSIDADKYRVGPNDLFTLGLYGYLNQQVPIVVSPEGTVVIPTVGEVDVNGLSINQAKSRVVAAVKKRYYSSDVSFTLNTPRTFLIKVTGLTQGTFEVSPVMRVSEILQRLYYDTLNTSRVQYEKNNEREFFLTQISLRNIELVRKDGTVKNVDVYKYFLNNNDDSNPFFLEGDLLKIPYVQLDKKFVTVSGAVQLPGSYEHVDGDDLETVIGIARGFDVNAEPDSVMIYRAPGYDGKFEQTSLNYEQNKDYKIKNFDRIFVKYKTNYQQNLSVLILGEIERPGYYPITYKSTRLKDVIEMAGGLRDKAYLPLSILFRTNDAEYTAKDSAEILISSRANDLLVTEMDRQNFEEDVRGKRNRVIVDFEKLIKDNDQSQNVQLEGKDIIYINDNKNIVYVWGQVNQEGYVPYKKGEDYEYYIERAGGYSLAADESNTRVIKFNSRGWYKPDEIEVMSGDYIYVPKVVQETFSETITIIAQIAGVILGVLTTYILIKQNQ